MTIYEIEQAMMECYDTETGEVDVEKLEQLEMEREKKLENVGCWIKNLKAEIDAFKNEEKNLATRRKARENRLESLKNYLAYSLHGEKLKTARVSISWRRSSKVQIDNEYLVPDEYKTYTPTISKTAIKDAIEKGENVAGARIVESTSIQIK